MSEPLLNYSRNEFSQNGEDGIIEEICRRLKVESGFLVDVGAWDGRHLSNTHSLLLKGWSGVLIEGDTAKYRDLLETIGQFPGGASAINAYVQQEGDNTLDRVLAETDAPRAFDLLNIDIDSYDWQVWRSLEAYEPKIVVIECNTSIPPGLWQVHTAGVTQGASFSALVDLGKKKGYTPVCHTGNVLFVRDADVGELELEPLHRTYPEALFNYRKHQSDLAYMRWSTRVSRALFDLRERGSRLKSRILKSDH